MDNIDITMIDVTPSTINSIHANSTGASMGYSFYNATGEAIYVTARNGIIIKINPSFNNHLLGKFIVRYNLVFDKDENVTVPVNSEEEDVAKTFYDSFANSTESRYVGKRSLHYDNVITLDELKEANGVLYLRNLDVMVSLSKAVDKTIHPFSELATTKRMLRRIKDEGNEFTDYSIRIVDNKGSLTTQYVKLAGKVYAIKPVRDMKSKDGVYILENKLVTKDNSQPSKNSTWSKLEDHRIDSRNRKEPIMFKRYEDALNFNDLQEVERMEHEKAINEFRKKEMAHRETELSYRQSEKDQEIKLKNAEMDFKEKEMELKKSILDLERKKRFDEEEIDRLKREHQLELAKEKNILAEAELKLKSEQQKFSEEEIKHKMELMKLKENFEIKSNQRKNAAEIIRSAPVIIGALIGLAGIIYGRRA